MMRALPLLFTVVVVAVLVGCGGSQSSSVSGIPLEVALSPTPATSIQVGAQTQLTAVVSSDPMNAGVAWSVNCGSTGACGGFSVVKTASGTPTTYTAPAAIPNGGTVIIWATSVTPSAGASAAITVTASLSTGN